jgi:hypothetical protein
MREPSGFSEGCCNHREKIEEEKDALSSLLNGNVVQDSHSKNDGGSTNKNNTASARNSTSARVTKYSDSTSESDSPGERECASASESEGESRSEGAGDSDSAGEGDGNSESDSNCAGESACESESQSNGDSASESPGDRDSEPHFRLPPSDGGGRIHRRRVGVLWVPSRTVSAGTDGFQLFTASLPTGSACSLRGRGQALTSLPIVPTRASVFSTR